MSAFILFHWACVAAWLWPNPSTVKTALMSVRMPVVTRDEGGWTVGSESIAAEYLFHTAQHQDWAMFAPDPLQINRYTSATVTFRDGTRAQFGFPRLCRLDVLSAWVQKRYRKYQHRIAEEPSPAFRRDLARYIARQMSRPGNPAVRVQVYDQRSAIPRHDRPGADLWVDYTRLLREDATFTPVLLVDYRVRPEDLR